MQWNNPLNPKYKKIEKPNNILMDVLTQVQDRSTMGVGLHSSDSMFEKIVHFYT
jgi:hypothetical protein